MYKSFHAILIGVGKYLRTKGIESPANDVKAMDVLLSGMGFQVTSLVDEAATKSEIEKVFQNFGDDGLLVVFFSGHSLEMDTQGNSKKRFKICPFNFDHNFSAETSVDILELAHQLSESNVRHTLFLLNCCFSSSIFDNKNISIHPNLSLVENNKQKGVWAIVCGGKQVVEKEYGGEMRSLFGYYIQQALQFVEEQDEGVFGSEYQNLVNIKSSDSCREKVRVVNPQEIVGFVRRKMLSDKQAPNIPRSGSLLPFESVHQGIPIIGCSVKDYSVEISKQIEIEAQANVTEEEVTEEDEFDPEIEMQIQKSLHSFSEKIEIPTVREGQIAFFPLQIELLGDISLQEKQDPNIAFEISQRHGIPIEKIWEEIEEIESNQFITKGRRVSLIGECGIGLLLKLFLFKVSKNM